MLHVTHMTTRPGACPRDQTGIKSGPRLTNDSHSHSHIARVTVVSFV